MEWERLTHCSMWAILSTRFLKAPSTVGHHRRIYLFLYLFLYTQNVLKLWDDPHLSCTNLLALIYQWQGGGDCEGSKGVHFQDKNKANGKSTFYYHHVLDVLSNVSDKNTTFAGHSVSCHTTYSLLVTHPSQSLTLGTARKSVQIFTSGLLSFWAMWIISSTAFSCIVLYAKLEAFQVTQSSILSSVVGYLQTPKEPNKHCVSFWAVKNAMHSNILSY